MREILKVSLGIARDVPILRVKRAHTGVRARSFVYLPLFLNCLFVYVTLRIFQFPSCFFDPCWTGSNVRGAKPVTVYFGKYEDKEEVLRQVIQMGELCNFFELIFSAAISILNANSLNICRIYLHCNTVKQSSSSFIIIIDIMLLLLGDRLLCIVKLL